ncbi:hypothetical protein BH23CHL2_BH23CHL2_33700 [soil metagenome]
MLSKPDAQLVQRDSALPGLGVLLDSDALREQIDQRIDAVSFASFKVDYTRYKPERNCLVRFRATTASNDRSLSGYAKAYRSDAGVKIDKAKVRDTASSVIGPGRLVLSDLAIEICFLPNDNKLDQLSRLIDPETRQGDLSRLQPDGQDWSRAGLTELNYKPERRYVARLDIPNGPPAVFRFYSGDEYGPAQVRVMKRISSEIRIPCLIGRSDNIRALAVSWLPGRPLNGYFPNGPGLIAAIESAGAALATFHRTAIPPGLPRFSPKDRPRRVRATSKMIRAILPDASRVTKNLGRSIRSALSEVDRPALSLIHGDLHTRQIILDGGTVGLIDLDEIRQGEPAHDLGLLLAHFDRDALTMGWPAGLQDEWADALLRGYRRQGGRIDLERITIHRAAGLFQLLPHHFRHRSPDWPDQVTRGLERVQELMTAPARRLIPTAV